MGKKDKQKKHPELTKNNTSNIRTSKVLLKVPTRKLQRVALFIISILIYSATINFDYTLDDTLMITQNNYTKEGVAGIKNIMTNDALSGFLGKGKNLLPGGRYRPLSHVLFAAEYELTGLKALDKIKDPTDLQKQQKENREKMMKVMGHGLNILLYACLSLLIFSVLLRLFKHYENPDWYASVSFISTLIFIVHPLHTEITCNIKNVDELMSMTGVMSLLWILLKYYDTKKILLLLPAAFIYLLAVLSKEDSFTFLAVIPLTFFVFTKASLKEHLILFSPLAAGLAAYFLIRYNALGFFFSNNAVNNELLNNPFLNASPAGKFATVMFTWGIYLKLLFIPYPLTHDYYPYHIQITNLSDPLVILSMLIWLSLIIYAVIRIFKKDIIAYGIMFFLITFSISSNLVFNIGAFMNERFVFIPLLGFAIIISWLLLKYLPRFTKYNELPRHIISSIIIIISIVFSLQTFARSFAWKNDYTLFTTDVKTSKNSAKCNVSAGGMIYHKALEETDKSKRDKMLQDAIKYLKRGVEIYPGYVAGLLELGNAYLEYKNYPEAKASYETVLKINPKHPNALNNMLALAQRAALDSNYAYSNIAYETLLKYEPDKTDYLLNIASNMLELKRIDTSRVILENIIKIDKNYDKAYSKLGEMFGRYYNDLAKAEQYLMKAYEINPKDASTLENLGIVCGMKGKFQESIDFFNKALLYNPDDPRIFANIAGTYNQMKQPEKAREYSEKAMLARQHEKNKK